MCGICARISIVGTHRIGSRRRGVNPCNQSCYLPHRAVMKESSSTAKLLVVFQVSSKTSGVSLNDKLLVGPKLRDDVIRLLIRFLQHAIHLIADLTKL